MSGVIAGILFGLIITAMSYISDKKLKKEGMVNKNTDVNQVREYMITQPTDEIVASFKEALNQLKKYKVVNFNEKNSIRVNAAISWKSIGETITLSTQSIYDTESRIKISSRPWLKTTLFDYGKNFHNVGILAAFFKTKYGNQLQEIDDN